MFLQIFSVYDTVACQSIFVTMHHTTAEAVREFKRFTSDSSISSKKDDLILVRIGDFNPSEPCILDTSSFQVFPEVIE